MMRLVKWVLALVIILAGAAYVVATAPQLNTLYARMAAFDATYGTRADHARALSHFVERFPSRTVHRAGPVSTWPEARRDLSALTYKYDGVTRTLPDFFTRNDTRGLLIIHKGQLVYEQYAEGTGPHTRFTSMSVAKSVTSTLVGLALEDGLIESLDDPLTKYLPYLIGTAYDGVSIEQALEMSSGIQFFEDYEPGDVITDIAQFMSLSIMLNALPANEAAAMFERVHAPGTKFNYNTAETQILGALVHEVTGKPLADYLSEKLWQPLGMEHDAAWALDAPEGMEVAGCCLNVSLRDYARLGELFRLNGLWQGQRLLPESWVARATTPQNPQVQYGQLFEVDPDKMGYGYQWWLRPGGDFSAQGVFGQFVYIDQKADLVIAMTSAWPEGWIDAKGSEAYAFFDGVAGYLNR